MVGKIGIKISDCVYGFRCCGGCFLDFRLIQSSHFSMWQNRYTDGDAISPLLPASSWCWQMHGGSVFLVYLSYRRSLPSPHTDWESSSSSLGPFHIHHHDSQGFGSHLDHLIVKLLCISLTWASTLFSVPATHKLTFTSGFVPVTTTGSKSSGERWAKILWPRLRGLPL